MVKFKQLFSFSKGEVDYSFKNSYLTTKTEYFTFLRANPENKGQKFGKLLIITSRKIGKANERNLLRRRLKAIFYEEKLYKVIANFIIIVRKPAVTLEFEEIKKILKENTKSA